MAEDRREIARGAEAVLYRARRDGADILIKDRVPKGYRHPILDGRLRRGRTKREARLLAKARAGGVPCPAVLAVDNKGCTIIMEYIDGPQLRTVANEAAPEERQRLFGELGRMVGTLHSMNMVHGDLTTSNVLVRDGQLFLIDFGLGTHSTTIEDKAVDLHLLERAIDATHWAFNEEAFAAVKEGYAAVLGDAGRVFDRIGQIEGRRRYT